LWPHPYQGCAL